MIEVNLYSIQPGDNHASVGKCVARNRFDKDAMGITIEDFAKGFLKNNLEKFEVGIGNSELTELINTSEATFTRRDIACINHYLIEAGYMLQIQNVTDDEENATGVPSGSVIEWNVIDRNFIQYDYPTATKILPGDGVEIPAVLNQIVKQSGLFNADKFAGLKNPFTSLLANLDRVKNVTGNINSSIVARIYEYLDELGISVFCATSED